MTKKNPKRNKPNIFKRWYVYKYSGLITTPLVLGAILIPWFLYIDTLEFYDKFTCDGLVIYKINNTPLEDNPTYNDMTLEQKEKYDTILEECKRSDGIWYYRSMPIIGDNVKILNNEITIEGKNPYPITASHEDFGG